MKKILETERLVLRQFNENDTPFIIELLNTEGWLKYIGDRNIKTEEDALQYLKKGPLKSYEENGFGLSMVELKESSQSIGMSGLIKRDDLQDIDIGFALLPAYEGYGYAYEIATAILRYGFETIGINRIVAITLPSNKNSIKLLEKLGLQYEKEISKDNTELSLFGLNQLHVK